MSTSESSALAAQTVSEYDAATKDLTCTIAVTMLLLYDIVLTLRQEYEYIWRSPKSSFSRLLYAWNRYMILFFSVLTLGTIPPLSNTSCTTIVWLNQSVYFLNFLGPAMFTTLRVYALSKKNRLLGGVALVLSLAPFIINVTTAYQEVPTNLPAPLNCTNTVAESTSLYIGLLVTSRTCLILADTLAVAVTWRQTRAATQLTIATRRRMSLEQVMLENGSIYFCTLVSLNVVNMALVIASTAIQGGSAIGPAASYVTLFIDPISSIMNSRFLLALHETNARMEGANMSISSLSLDVNSGGDPAGDGSPELPDFIELFGGPIHSFHDEGDVESLEFAQPSQGEHQSEEIANEAEVPVEDSGAEGNLA